MSARIAPRAETIGIAFSPHLPRFLRSRERKHQEAPTPGTEQNDADPLAPPAGFGASATGNLPSQIIFEAALLGLQQSIDPLTPQEVARRLRNEWSPPVAGFKLTDKTI
jgi:hypothetical protein